MPLDQNPQADFRRDVKKVGTNIESLHTDATFNVLIANAYSRCLMAS
jgi:hypothetical protein